jgi:hypothetical protein
MLTAKQRSEKGVASAAGLAFGGGSDCGEGDSRGDELDQRLWRHGFQNLERKSQRPKYSDSLSA